MISFLKNSILVILCLGISLAARSQCTPTISSANSAPCTWAIYATFSGSGYQWFRNSTAINGATSSSITVTQGGSYTLRATVSGCGIGTSSPMVIQDPPVASISVTAGSTNFCAGGGSATLTAQTGTGYSYQWRKDGTPNGTTTSSYVATVAGSYTCQVTNTACSLLSNAITVTTPAASLAIGSSSTSASCGSAPITLYLAGPSVSGYQWYLNSAPISGANSMTYNPTQTGSYYLSAVVCGSTISSNSISITISGSPSISPQGNPNVCQPGGTISFNVTNYDPTATYQWKNSNNTSATLGSGSTYTANQSGTYYVIETKNGFNCTSNTIPANFFTINTTITPSGSLTYCPGDNLVLTATPGYSLYFWSKDGVSIGGSPVSANTCTVTAAGTYTLSIQQQGCTQSSSPIIVTAGSTSTPTISGSPNACLGSSTNNSYQTETGKTGYVWTAPGGTISGQGTNAINVTWNTLGAQNVSVSYNGCIATPTLKNVTVNPLPVPTFTQGSTTVCSSSAGNIYATESGMSNYSWSVSGGTIDSGQGTSSISVTWTTPGPQTVSVSYSNGLCTSQPSVLNVNILALPAAQVAAEGLPVFCDGGSVQLVAASQDGYSFQWYKDNAVLPGATTSQYQATAAGSYKITTSQNGCSNTSAPFAVTTTTRPNATITPAGTTTICQGQTAVLNASTGNNYTYQWKNEQGNIAGATSPNYAATQSGVYTLVTKVGSCSAESTGLAIVVNPLPVVSIVSSGATTFCENEPITLLAIGDADSYQWENNSGSIGGEVANSYIVHESNTFKVLATKGSCTLESNAIATIRKPQPSPVSSFTGPTTLPAGDKLNYTITGNSTDDVYLWNTPAGTNIVYGDQRRTSATIGFNQLGERIISVTAQKNGCDSEPVEKILQVIEAVSSVPSQIPLELKVSPDNQTALPLISHSLRLDSFNQDDIKPVFEECQPGQYWAGFQLYYDALADLNTAPQWTALVDVTLTQGENTILWTRSLQVDMISQTFISTIFHDTPITCTDDYRFKIKTKSTYINGVQAPEQNIYLKVLLYKRMLDVFDPALTLSLNALQNNGNIEASWSYGGNAVKGFDLEWVMIEDHESFTPSTSHAAIDAFKFKEPVRVTVGPADFFYKHHAFYPSGRMWFRARAIGYNPPYPGHVIPGQWFYGSDTPLTIINPEAFKNWQLQTVFAEEGKYKKVMSYFDGTLRQRQSQTNLSTDDLTLVGETLYDFEGRRSVDILSAPTADVSLHYQAGFNAFAGSDPTVLANTSATQKKFHYDNRDLVNSVLSQATGAGKYYSEMNAIGSPSMGPKDYVPDADGYVYNQTEFLNDGTGRVSRQSGVGEMFRMEGGHNTRNYYTEAARVELTRLFGPNVGNASHYKKNVTVDPNGQVSVSYVDQTGKVIATALAGKPPENVDALPSYNATLASNPLTVDLKSKNVIKDGTSKTIHKFLNEAVNTSYTFNYSLSAAGVTVPGFNCQACTYDFAITITDPSGALLDLGTIAGNESGTTKRYQRNNLNAGCGTSSPLSSVQFVVVLTDIGDYTITKTLTAHELTFDQIATLVQQDPDVQNNIQTTITNSYVIDPGDCAICTATCTEIDGAISDAINEIADLDCSNIMQNIIQDLTDRFSNGDPNYVPADNDIQNHALYCKYQLCMKDKASDIFEKQLVLVTTWSNAVTAGYVSADPNNPSPGPKLSNASNTQDPFFNNEELSGYAKRGDMQAKINSITIASKNGVFFTGSLDQVTDPGNTNYYVNSDGQHDAGGYHILYYSLMSQHAAGLGNTDFNTQLDQQRWTLFRNFYLEQKRKTKLTIDDYNLCTEARKSLQIQDDISSPTLISENQTQTAHNVDVWGQNYTGVGKGINVNVSDPELETWIASLGLNCKSTFTSSEVTSMTNSLRNYFNKSNVTNFLREILVSDIRVDPDLIAVQNILNNYGCSLDSVAEQSYLTCKSYATYSGFGPNLISNPAFSGCPVNANISPSCSGWTISNGTPYLMSDTGFQLDVANCSQDALMNTFTSPLVPGQKYKLSFKYKTSATSGSSFSYVMLSSSTGFGVPTGGGALRVAQNIIQPLMVAPCPSMPTVLNPDYVTDLNGQSRPTLWVYANAPTSYTNFETTFIATQASKYIFFYQSTSDLASITIDAIFKDVALVKVITGATAPTCKEYNSLTQWAYTPDWQAAVDLCNQHAAEERSDLIAFATNKYIEQQASEYRNTFRTNCINTAVEQLNYIYSPKEYHYTLYYYDQSSNLVQTVPPAGVHPLSDTDANSATPGYPPHDLITNYHYTSINQLTWQSTPDAGISEFVYDKKGQLRVSHNAQQTIDGKYSYTKYDEQGRVTEVGELTAADALATVSQYVDDPRFPTAGVPELPAYATADVTNTHYDNPNDAITPKLLQQNLRARISWVEVANQNDPDKSITYYNYDIHGNVKSLVQQIPGLEVKRTDYVYDLISGKVNYVFYQRGQADQFIHKYTYDADNRIKTASTSSDAYLWYQDASYKYYAHGPLARTEVGEYRVQGQDYYYTLQGWIKGVNMPYAGDPGADGIGTSKVGKDTYAYTLGYYQNDYKPSNASLVLSDTRDQQWTQFGSMMNNSTGLYNGNISWMTTDLAKIGEINNDRTKGMQTMLYRYDQLHRIKKSQSLTAYAAGSGFAARTTTPDAYDEQYSYDANGNIMTLQRYNNQAALLDDFTYQYYNHKNRLASVRPITTTLEYSSAITTSSDKAYGTIVLKNGAYVPAGSTVKLDATEAIITEENNGENGFYTEDGADFMAHILGGDNDGVFVYDAIGNLIQNKDEGVVITWTPYGKIREVRMNDGAQLMSYQYDAAGNRVRKTVVNSGTTTVTHYVRDASGNVMSVYNNLVVQEQVIYGSVRLGEFKGTVVEGVLILGKRNFEFGNHLGNVLTVATDNVNFQGSDIFAKVINTSDYYPFGLEMDGRSYTDATAYRYGFNGKEKDSGGEFGNTHYDYGFRIYNPGIGKFLSVDPLTASYPMLTPYQFASNIPIAAIDLDGLESKFVIQWLSQPHGDGTRTVIKTETLVKPDLVHPQVYAAGLAGKVAVTETYYYDNNNNYLGNEYLYEPINENWPKPSASYDYTKGAISGKGSDDKAFAGFNPGLWALIFARDANAPDNARIIEDIEVLTASQGLPIFGRWVRTTETMSVEAGAYQKQITGRSADRSYLVNGTKFDGLKNGTLIDAKSGYANFINKKTGEFHNWFKGRQSLVDQANRQIKAAGGNPIQWHFENQSVRDATEKLFKKEGISGIDLIHTPKK